MASLMEMSETTHSEKRQIYRNFHAFHKRHYKRSRRPNVDLPDTLDMFLQTGEKGKPLENPAPPALLNPVRHLRFFQHQ
jgi:hypothetical protein